MWRHGATTADPKIKLRSRSVCSALPRQWLAQAAIGNQVQKLFNLYPIVCYVRVFPPFIPHQMKLPVLVCFLACAGLSRPADAQAPGSPANIGRTGADCLARMAALPGRGTSTIEPARLRASDPMPAFQPGGLRRFVASVVVDTAGRAEPATVRGPAELDSTAVNAIRTVIPEWRFSPARVAGCPVRQVVRMTFTR